MVRAKIILLADEGLSNDVIAPRLDTPRQIVSKWRSRAKSWGKSRINLLAASFGSWTIVPLIVARKPSSVFATSGPTQSSSILRSTPVGSIKSKSISQSFNRKVLTPNDFSSLAELEQRLLAFQCHYERTASPFKWMFTRSDLHTLLAKIAAKQLALAA